MSRQYRPFIDWMKAVGIFLIVCGHVAARPLNHLTPPIYPKQLGVAFFVFVLGFSLASERRPRSQVLFNRLFEMYLYAVPLALAISALAPIRHTYNPSNYLPFLFGANVVLNNFPANPTTWYVGTYLHILLVWALLIRFSIRGWMIVLSIAAEIVIRYMLMGVVGGYVAYMSLFNWSTVFLFGLWWGRRGEQGVTVSWGSASPWLAGTALLTLVWARWMPSLVEIWSFPFATMSSGIAGARLLTSAAVSGAYLSFAALFYEVARRLPAAGVARFLARNTLFIFLAHMPVFYLVGALTGTYELPYAWTAAINLAVCLVLVAVVSEALNRLIRPHELRQRATSRLFGRRAEAAAVSGLIV